MILISCLVCCEGCKITVIISNFVIRIAVLHVGLNADHNVVVIRLQECGFLHRLLAILNQIVIVLLSRQRA